MDANLKLFVDGDDHLCFVQGEDRTSQLCFFDSKVGTPVDLTGATVSVSLPAASGGVIRRTSYPLVAAPAGITLGTPGVINYPDHGLADGDVVQLVGAGLPAPLVAGTGYTVVRNDMNNFSLSLAGIPVALTSVGTATFTLSAASNIVIGPTPQAGCAIASLSAAATNEVNPGQAQDFQADIVVTGRRRICVMSNALTVAQQPEP